MDGDEAAKLALTSLLKDVSTPMKGSLGEHLDALRQLKQPSGEPLGPEAVSLLRSYARAGAKHAAATFNIELGDDLQPAAHALLSGAASREAETAEVALEKKRSALETLLAEPTPAAESDAVKVAKIQAAVEQERIALQHVEALRKMESDEAIASLQLEIKRLEGDQQRNLAEINNAHDQRKAAEARATELGTAKLKAESDLQLEREKSRNAIIVEGKRAKATIVVAAVGLVSAAIGSVATLLAKGDSLARPGGKVELSAASGTPGPSQAQPSIEAQKIAMTWKAHATDAANVSDIRGRTSNHLLVRKELADALMTKWRSEDGEVCADFTNQSVAVVSIDRFLVLQASRDAEGNIYASGDFSVLGGKLTYEVFRMNNGQSPPKLILSSVPKGSLVLELGDCSTQ